MARVITCNNNPSDQRQYLLLILKASAGRLLLQWLNRDLSWFDLKACAQSFRGKWDSLLKLSRVWWAGHVGCIAHCHRRQEMETEKYFSTWHVANVLSPELCHHVLCMRLNDWYIFLVKIHSWLLYHNQVAPTKANCSLSSHDWESNTQFSRSESDQIHSAWVDQLM